MRGRAFQAEASRMDRRLSAKSNESYALHNCPDSKEVRGAALIAAVAFSPSAPI
jgi:hypothetical protein